MACNYVIACITVGVEWKFHEGIILFDSFSLWLFWICFKSIKIKRWTWWAIFPRSFVLNLLTSHWYILNQSHVMLQIIVWCTNHDSDHSCCTFLLYSTCTTKKHRYFHMTGRTNSKKYVHLSVFLLLSSSLVRSCRSTCRYPLWYIWCTFRLYPGLSTTWLVRRGLNQSSRGVGLISYSLYVHKHVRSRAWHNKYVAQQRTPTCAKHNYQHHRHDRDNNRR